MFKSIRFALLGIFFLVVSNIAVIHTAGAADQKLCCTKAPPGGTPVCQVLKSGQSCPNEITDISGKPGTVVAIIQPDPECNRHFATVTASSDAFDSLLMDYAFQPTAPTRLKICIQSSEMDEFIEEFLANNKQLN